jgi:hypothetical protein
MLFTAISSVQRHGVGDRRWTIEFQKRGLPHAHILLTLAPEDKLRSPADYDTLISAEVPDPVAEPDLYETVTRNMMHGPCGSLKPDAPCMEVCGLSTLQSCVRDVDVTCADAQQYTTIIISCLQGEPKLCTKKYPRAFCDVTTDSKDGYPVYRRREATNRKVLKGDVELDNQWVVPYNPALCKMFNCHINVEYCASIRSIKYLHKYIHKGHDMAQVGRVLLVYLAGANLCPAHEVC